MSLQQISSSDRLVFFIVMKVELKEILKKKTKIRFEYDINCEFWRVLSAKTYFFLRFYNWALTMRLEFQSFAHRGFWLREKKEYYTSFCLSGSKMNENAKLCSLKHKRLCTQSYDDAEIGREKKSKNRKDISKRKIHRLLRLFIFTSLLCS